MVETGTLLQNRYLIEKQIGEGGMGAVYLAIDQRFDSPVAIKETFYNDADLREAFEREARLLNSLHHPVLPHVSDYFSEGNKHFIVMEYIAGEDLSEILKREGAFDVQNVMRWIDNLLDALDYLHSQEPPIIHRDLKPQNLKQTPRGDIILLDFGLAKLNSSNNSTVKSVFGYSRKYSPLEQIQGTGTDARADIFALGATAYHLFTGKPPLDAIARASAIVAGRPDPLQLASEINNQIPLQVAQVLQAAMALNPDRRFESANAMRKALEYALNSKPVLVEQELPAEEAVVIAASENQTSIPSEAENFTALESFAADVAQVTPEIHPEGALPPVQVSKGLVVIGASKNSELTSYSNALRIALQESTSSKDNEPPAAQAPVIVDKSPLITQVAREEPPIIATPKNPESASYSNALRIALQESASAGTENFTAPESFAADVTQITPEIKVDREPHTVQASPVTAVKEQPLITQVSQPKSATVTDVATRVRRPKKSLLPLAALIAVLIAGALAVWFVTNAAKSSNEPEQTPVADSALKKEEVATEQSSGASVSPKQEVPIVTTREVSAKPSSENKPRTRQTPAPKETPVVETSKPSVEPPARSATNEPPERPEPRTVAPPSTPRPRPAQPTQAARRNTQQRVVVVQSAPPSSIERIMTGEQPDERRQRREERQRRRQMSGDEKEELHQRRIQDLLRRNRQPLQPK